MDSNYRAYEHIASFERIDEILAQPAGNFEEVKSLPDRDRLTFTNGFYANCTALFVDIRDSSKLPEKYNRPALAKLYRAFISEAVAVLNGNATAREINIVGDCVWAVYNTPYRSDIDMVFSTAARLNSLRKTLNHKLSKAGYSEPIRFGIGIAYGRALMIKAGHKGSTINDVVYMGDVVNSAAHLANEGGKTAWAPPIYMDADFWGNLNEANQALTQQQSLYPPVHTADVVNTVMNDWFEENCT